MSQTLYKFLLANGEPAHGGSGAWDLPRGDQPGAWREADGHLAPCSNGLHLCRKRDLPEWVTDHLFVAEYDGQRITQPNNIVVRRARLIRQLPAWTTHTLVLWAADCAERILPFYETAYPGDPRPRVAIDAARAAASPAAADAAIDAARSANIAADAARDAARTANIAAYDAGDGVYAATHAAYAATYASYAAAYAARAASYAAAYVDHASSAAIPATSYAARAATAAADAASYASYVDEPVERRWQATRLLRYANGRITP